MSYPYLNSLEKFGVNLGLKRIKHLLAKLDNPHNNFRSFHIAGTNGKGSTAAMIASILKEAGYKVGLYTSPHIFDYTERIKINGKDISSKEFEEGLRRVKRAVDGLKRAKKALPTVFESLTAVAFWYFAKEKVDIAVVEVGLGGRLDATNVLKPLVSVITNIDLEHTEVLGRTISKVAAEKASIIKPGVPVVTAEKKPTALKVMKKAAKRWGSFLIQVEGYDSAKIPHLIGEHQRLNAGCAVAAVRLSRIIVTHGQVVKGLKKTHWPGRFQIVSRKPLIIMDGAHNPAGARALSKTVKKLYPKQKFVMIFGCQKTKDYRKVLKELKPLVKTLVLTRSTHRESMDPEWLADNIEKKWRGPIATTGSAEQSLKLWDGKHPLLITGSLFLVADVLSLDKM